MPVAGLLVAQVALDVTTQVITSEIVGTYVYVLFVPTTAPPFMCQA